MRTAAIIRHVAFEDLGLLGPVLAERGIAAAYYEAGLDDLAALDPEAPDLVVVLGGPIAAYEREAYPFLNHEIALLDHRAAAGRPILGVCLGAQLLARALGARTYPGRAKEIGWGQLSFSAAGAASPLRHLAGTPVLHWHGDTFDLPAGATLLASTDQTPNQAFAVGPNILGLQFHAEATLRGLERWYIGHAGEIAATPGISVAGLRLEGGRWAPALEPGARAFFGEWLAAAGL